MKRLIVILFIFLTGCSSINVIRPVCRHYTLLNAAVFAEKYPIRIAYMKGNPPHCQAQAYINGKWEWLNSYQTAIFTGIKDSNHKVSHYIDLETILNWSLTKQKYLTGDL